MRSHLWVLCSAMLIAWFYHYFYFWSFLLPPSFPPLIHSHTDDALVVMLRRMQKKPMSRSLSPRSSGSNWGLKVRKQETLPQ